MSSSRFTDPWNPLITWWILVSIVGVAFGVHLWGIRQNLPFVPEIDEPVFVTRAVHMAASGDLNPGWFGNPGSTVMYPLAALYRTWHAVVHRGMFFHPDPNLQGTFDSNPGEFYLLGRLLTVAYAVMSIPFVYQIGRRAFGERAGLIGLWFSMLPPVAVAHAQVVRTDSAAVFFGMLSLWLCLRVYDRPTTGNHIVAGLAVGLSIATRYFMVALIPVLLAVDGLILRRQASRSGVPKDTWLGVGAGLLAIAVSFALSTPFLFLDSATALNDLALEARSTHLGADGLSPAGNFSWYLTRAIPLSITWPQATLAALGVALVVWKRQPPQILLLGFVLTFLAGISLSPLHWQRWVIQILPLLALFAAHALDRAFAYLSPRLRPTGLAQRVSIATTLLLISAWPAYQLILFDVRQASRSTRILAREWVVQNLPAGSRIAQEWYTAPLGGTDFDVLERFSLAEDRTLGDYRRDGYRYLVASSAVYGRYLAEPERYPSEVAFYQALFGEGHLLQQFEPSATRGGTAIRIYELQDVME
jgi:hypothetical protein